MTCIHGVDGPQFRRASNMRKCERVCCTNCGLSKVDYAFPKAQHKQFDQIGKRLCLKCCASRVTLKCSRCNSTKLAEDFEPPMLTMPDDIITCRASQEQAKGVTERRLRQGWITCRKCRAILPLDQCGEGRRQQFCPNCTTGCKPRSLPSPPFWSLLLPDVTPWKPVTCLTVFITSLFWTSLRPRFGASCRQLWIQRSRLHVERFS